MKKIILASFLALAIVLILYKTATHEYILTSLITYQSYPLCNNTKSNLIGPLNTNYTISGMEEVEKLLENQGIEFGGKWSPPDCIPQHHVAILISFLDRDEHLKKLLLHLHPMLSRQKLSYGIYLIEPVQGLEFNKGILHNAGFIESNKESNDLWQCHVYHDVDVFAEDDRTMYSCPENPTHLVHLLNKFNYTVLYGMYFGGGVIIKKEQYIKANGYSNAFYGWGGSDDDHYYRVGRFFKIEHYPPPYNRFTMIKHGLDKKSPPRAERFKLLAEGYKRYDKEGLNNVEYKVESVVKTKLYTKFFISYDVNKTYV